MRTIFTIAIVLCSIGAMAQTDTSKLPVPPSAFYFSTDTTKNIGMSGTNSTTLFINGGPIKWVNLRTLLVSYPLREQWSVGPVNKNGNAKVYVKRSMVHWLNDSTMYINTRIKKHFKTKHK